MEEFECFVLLASPGSAKAGWVHREVEHRLKSCRDKRTAQYEDGRRDGSTKMVLIDGAISWVGDYSDWGRTTALPSILDGVFKEQTTWLSLSDVSRHGGLSLQNESLWDGWLNSRLQLDQVLRAPGPEPRHIVVGGGCQEAIVRRLERYQDQVAGRRDLGHPETVPHLPDIGLA